MISAIQLEILREHTQDFLKSGKLKNTSTDELRSSVKFLSENINYLTGIRAELRHGLGACIASKKEILKEIRRRELE